MGVVDGCVADGWVFLVNFLIFRPSILAKMFCGESGCDLHYGEGRGGEIERAPGLR